MGEVKDFINLYIEDSGLIEEKLDEITLNLTANIQDQLYPGHGYDTGNLHDSIKSNITSKSGLNATIEAYTMVEYAKYVNDGTRPHPIVSKKGPGSRLNTPFGIFRMVQHPGTKGLKFMEGGLDATVAMYR